MDSRRIHGDHAPAAGVISRGVAIGHPLRQPLEVLIADQINTNDLQLLPVTLPHVLALQDLPAHHKDPFDRMLIAQANIEDAVLLSSDPVMSKYAVRLNG